MRRGKGELREFVFDWLFLLGVYIIMCRVQGNSILSICLCSICGGRNKNEWDLDAKCTGCNWLVESRMH